MRIALYGAGGMGAVHHANYAHIPGTEVVAVIGNGKNDQERASSWGIPFFTSLSEAAQAVSFSIVDVCTPTFLHKECILQALKEKKTVITEKPLALKSEDARMLFLEARKARKRIYVAQVLQFTRPVGYLRDMVREGTWGKVTSAHFVRLTAAPAWSAGGWLFDKAKSGLIPFDLHIHDLDVIVSLFGKPESAQAWQTGAEDSSHADHISFRYGWQDKCVTAEAAWYPAHDFPFTATFRVAFEKAVVVNTGESMTVYPKDGEKIVLDIKDPVVVPSGINVPPSGWYYQELTHFLDCIEKDIPSPFVTERQVIDTLQTIESMGC